MLLNVVSLGVLLISERSAPRPLPPPGAQSPAGFLIDKVGFDEKQTEEYFQLIQQHRKEIEPLQRRLKKMQDQVIVAGVLDSTAGRSPDYNAVLKKIEKANLKHFKAVRELCQAEQKETFDRVLREMLKIMHAPPGKRPPHPHDRRPPPPREF